MVNRHRLYLDTDYLVLKKTRPEEIGWHISTIQKLFTVHVHKTKQHVIHTQLINGLRQLFSLPIHLQPSSTIVLVETVDTFDCRFPVKNRWFDQFRSGTDNSRFSLLPRIWTLTPFACLSKWDFRFNVPFNEWSNRTNFQFYTTKDFAVAKIEILVGIGTASSR
jgi:hypothetical protein